jgi:hypothetical protein
MHHSVLVKKPMKIRNTSNSFLPAIMDENVFLEQTYCYRYGQDFFLEGGVGVTQREIPYKTYIYAIQDHFSLTLQQI